MVNTSKHTLICYENKTNIDRVSIIVSFYVSLKFWVLEITTKLLKTTKEGVCLDCVVTDDWTSLLLFPIVAARLHH